MKKTEINSISKVSSLIIIVGLLIYSNSFLNSFHFDDFPSIVNNNAIRNVFNLHQIWSFWPTRFITYFSFALNYHWGGLDVVGFHALSLFLHIVTAILVWQLIRLTLNIPSKTTESVSQASSWIAFFTALIFLTHPLQTQAVNYLVQRAVIFSALFYLASLILYIKARLAWLHLKGSPQAKVFYIASFLCGILCVLSKENAASLPLMILFYESFFFSRDKVLSWKPVIPFVGIILIMPIVWFPMVLDVIKRPVNGFAQGMSAHQYFLSQGKVILIYLRLLFWPIHQSVEYDVGLNTSIFNPSCISSFLILAMIMGSTFILRKRFKCLSFGIFWFFITLMPESSFWPIKDLIFEHRLYLPMLGFSIFISSGIFYFFQLRRFPIAVFLLSLLVAGYSLMTYQRNKVWRNELTLWDDAVHQAPQCSRAYLNRGSAYQKLGDLDHAMADYNMVIGLGPIDPVTLSNRGLIFQQKGFLDLALANYNLSIQINPGFAATYENRGKLYQMEMKYNEAQKDFDKAIGMQPQNPVFYGERASVEYFKKDYEKCWQDVYQVEKLGSSIKPQYLHALEIASGRYQ